MKFVFLMTLAMMAVSCAHQRANYAAHPEGQDETQFASRHGGEVQGPWLR